MSEISVADSKYGFDLDNRDPTGKNEHVRVWFEDAFAEPDGTHSVKGVWSCSYKTFRCAKSCWYIFLSILCGGPCALLWGFVFACQSCYHIWCIGPCVKAMTIDLGCCKFCWSTCVRCWLDPCYEAVGRMFGDIKFRHKYEVV
uniref:Caveolin n=1 Tax=Ciona intestinalis TaxID=7719 RepID=H2XMN4_CIOIN|nr:caveolin-3-like [Ciona intestinalis]|eukprot:XP_002125921.1 caveolin-3-like [Ciona intestinalis]